MKMSKCKTSKKCSENVLKKLWRNPLWKILENILKNTGAHVMTLLELSATTNNFFIYILEALFVLQRGSEVKKLICVCCYIKKQLYQLLTYHNCVLLSYSCATNTTRFFQVLMAKTFFSKLNFKIKVGSKLQSLIWARTTDVRWGNHLHCTAENQLPLPNF